MKRDLKINFSILEEIIREIKKYRSALEEMERAASNMTGQLEKSTSKTVDELGKIYREFTAELKKCYTELEDLDIILSGYTHEMQAIIRPVNKGKFMRVDRNDIYFNKQAIIAACQEIKLLRLKCGMGLTSGWGFGRMEEEKAREEQNYRKLERIWQEVIPRYARKLDGQIDALNRIYNGKIIPFENKDDEYRTKADRLYGKYTNPWERIRTRSIAEIKLRTDLLRGIAAAIIDLVKGVYGLGKGVVCYAASGAVLAVTYPFSQRPRWAEENIKETNGAVSGILKDPMLLVEAFSQQVTDAYEEEGAGYCIGYAAGDFLGAKGLDKLANLGKVKLPEKSIPKEIGNTAADTGKILEKVEAPPVRRVTKAVDEAAVTEIGKGIEGAVKTWASTDKYVGETANAIEAKYPGKVVDVNKKVYRADGTPLTDYDIEFNNAIIQVKQGGGKGATKQAINTASSTSKEVIVYLPDQNAGAAVVKGLQKEGFKVFTNQQDLLNYLK